MQKNRGNLRPKPSISKKSNVAKSDDILHRLAFDNSLLANIISTVNSGKIVLANKAACKLLGYSLKELLTKRRSDIFDINESSFKKMLKQRKVKGRSSAMATAIQKSGKILRCEMTSSVFLDQNGIGKAITTIVDMRQIILTQKGIDIKKEKIVANNIVLAYTKQKGIDIKKEKTVADNIFLAKSNQKGIDIRKERIVANNIVLANSKQIGIDTRKEKIVAHNIDVAKSRQKVIDTKKEKIVAYNIDVAKSKQKVIDTKKEKIVADNIVIAKTKQKKIDTRKEKIVADNIVLAKSRQKVIDARKEKIVADNIILANSKEIDIVRLKQEINLKEKQIAKAREEAKETERSVIGRELHDNVNQLLCVSGLYLDMAKQGGKDSEMYLSRSSEYTLTAIEEIRKLTSGLTTDTIKKLGLCEAIKKVTRDTMEVNQVKISSALDNFIENRVNDTFKLNVFRIVQEQLNNILKHARATEVTISLSQNKKSIILSISDDGVGFDTSKQRQGIGVANIMSRAAANQGKANFDSQPGEGCILTVIFPVTDSLLDNS